ncbi:hypothetical protein LJR232_001609 [Aquipseudomonas alcaligenes]
MRSQIILEALTPSASALVDAILAHSDPSLVLQQVPGPGDPEEPSEPTQPHEPGEPTLPDQPPPAPVV